MARNANAIGDRPLYRTARVAVVAHHARRSRHGITLLFMGDSGNDPAGCFCRMLPQVPFSPGTKDAVVVDRGGDGLCGRRDWHETLGWPAP